MYRLATYSTPQDTMHFIVANLIHRGGWELIDASLDGSIVTAWPLPTEATPAMVGATWVVLRPPDAGLSLCGDRFQIELSLGNINIYLHRLDGGATAAWDTAIHAATVGATTLTTTMTFGVGGRTLVFSDSTSMVLADMNLATSAIASGYAWGYLRTAVLRGANTSPVLGAGEDPWPLCQFTLDNTKAAGPPPVLTGFGAGSVFDEGDVAVTSQTINSLLTVTASSEDLHTLPIGYGGGVPVHLLTRVLVTMDGGAGYYLRGTFPSVYLTTREVAEAVVRVDELDAEYLVVGANVAVGPL